MGSLLQSSLLLAVKFRLLLPGDFKNNLAPPDGNCSATYTYQGASDITSCKFRDDPSCTSQGPDLVAGAVHTLRERLDLLDFTMSYMTVRQITVKKGRAYEVNFLTTFQCFTEDLWFAGLFLEVGEPGFPCNCSSRSFWHMAVCSSVWSCWHDLQICRVIWFLTPGLPCVLQRSSGDS